MSARCLGFLVPTAAALAILGLAACGADDSEERSPARTDGSSPAKSPSDVPPAYFVELGHETGLDFRHSRAATGDRHLFEIDSGAVTVLDYDGDGRFDLFFPQSCALPGADVAGADLRDRMYRAIATFQFEDVTDEVRCSDPSYTLSAAAPDFDGDGDPDLFLSNYGRNRLLRNDDGVFTDVSDSAGLTLEMWSSASAWADYDRDGDLDAYVTNYADYDIANPIICGSAEKGEDWRAYCHPDELRSQRDEVWRNDGNGRFVDVTGAAGCFHSVGKGLGLLTLDYDDDGDIDIMVANDSTPNFFWHNLFEEEGRLAFRDDSDLLGVAVNREGRSESCMGIDAADIDQDGDDDVIVTNYAMESNTLYRADAGFGFEDASAATNLGPPSLPWVGFGARFFDVENDGDEDLFTVNGHVVDNIELYNPLQRFVQPAQLFVNQGGGRYQLAGPEAGPFFEKLRVGRALATFDADDDGDLDVIVVDNDGEAQLLRNDAGKGHWIGFELVGADANPQAIGATVLVQCGARTHRRVIRGANSYRAWSELRLSVGLGETSSVDTVIVRFPSGSEKRLEGPEIDRYHRVEE